MQQPLRDSEMSMEKIWSNEDWYADNSNFFKIHSLTKKGVHVSLYTYHAQKKELKMNLKYHALRKSTVGKVNMSRKKTCKSSGSNLLCFFICTLDRSECLAWAVGALPAWKEYPFYKSVEAEW